MSKGKKAAAAVSDGMKKAENYFIVPLILLKSNTPQPRRGGVIPNLYELGYGAFSQTEDHVNKKKAKNDDGSEKQALMALLLSDKPELQAIGVGLIDQHEPDLKELADSIAGNSQLHNIGIVPLDPNDPSKGYDVVYGSRRTLARAYNHARSSGDLPADIKAELADNLTDHWDIHFRAMAENSGRLSESPMDEARQYNFLKKQGVSINDIAKRKGTNPQNIRNRLKLLRLTADEQQRVHTGKMGMVKATKLVDERDKGTKTTQETAPDKPEERRRMPTLKQAQGSYSALEKPDAMSDEEWALWTDAGFRKGVAYFIGVPYQSHRDMVNEAKRLEKERLEAEAIRKAAEEAEAKEAESTAAAETSATATAAK